MRFGKTPSFLSGDVVLAEVQFTDSFEFKRRPALVLFEEYGNLVVAGITSNVNMKGIYLYKRKGLPRESVVKLNYVFTISKEDVSKKLFHLDSREKEEVYDELFNKFSEFKN